MKKINQRKKERRKENDEKLRKGESDKNSGNIMEENAY